jgi:membrane protease YdiL (CAAX protease family)
MTSTLLLASGAAMPDLSRPPVLYLYPLPPEAFSYGPWPLLPLVFLQSLILGSSMGEELGWRGFALTRLEERFGAVGASLVLGVGWALWHLPLRVATHALLGVSEVWFGLAVVGEAVIYTGVFKGTGGSVPAVMLLHSATSTTGLFLTASAGHPVVGVAITWMAAVLALGRLRQGTSLHRLSTLD